MTHQLTLADVEAYRNQGAGQRSGKYLRFYCPLHSGDSQQSFQYNPETGHWKCYQCGEYGYFKDGKPGSNGYKLPTYTPARKEIKPVRLDLGNLLKKYQDALPGSTGEAYLKGRGISLEVAQKYGIGYTAAGEWAGRKQCKEWRYGGIVIPHTDLKGMVINLYIRAVGEYEKIPAQYKPGEKEWKALKHDHLSGNKGVFNAPALSCGTVFICEGPFDALSLIAAGHENSCAIFGTNSLSGRWEWVQARALIFAFDNDPAGEKWKELADEAYLQGKKIYYLPATVFRNCKDLNEVWVKHGSINVGELPADEPAAEVSEKVSEEPGDSQGAPSPLHEGSSPDLGGPDPQLAISPQGPPEELPDDLREAASADLEVRDPGLEDEPGQAISRITDPFHRQMAELSGVYAAEGDHELADICGNILRGAARREPGQEHPDICGTDYIRALRQRYEAYVQERDALTTYLDDKTIPEAEREKHIERYREVIWFCEDHRIKLERADQGLPALIGQADIYIQGVDHNFRTPEDHEKYLQAREAKYQEQIDIARQWNEFCKTQKQHNRK